MSRQGDISVATMQVDSTRLGILLKLTCEICNHLIIR